MRFDLQKKKRRGATVVEVAVVSPLIFLLVFAGIEFGRLMMATHGLEEAAREGCRTAVLNDVTYADVQTAVDARLATFGMSGHTMTTVPAQPETALQWEPVTVNIAVPYRGVSWLPTPTFLGGIVLSASCTLSKESE
jgi:Flp pilus assembly protein TadG